MKKLLIALLLPILVVLIAPKLIGGVVETEHQTALNKLNENPAITVNSTTFTRQWFHGKATTQMTILVDGEEIMDITFIIEESLSFGPIIFTDEGIEFALGYSQADINFKNLMIDDEVTAFIKDKVHLSALLTFSNSIATNLVIDEISKKTDDNQIVSAQAVGKFILENNNRFYGDFTWAGLNITSNGESFSIEKLGFTVDQTLLAGDFFQGNAIAIGDFDFLLASVTAQDITRNTVLTLDNLSVNAKSSVKKDLMRITMNYSADKIVAADQRLENANLVVVFDNFNIHVMQEVNSLMSGLSTSGDAMLEADNMQKISQLIAKLLADEPVVEIEDLSVKTPEGKIESSMLVNIDKNLFDTANIMSIMPAIKAVAKAKAPRVFFDKLGLAPIIDSYIEQGLIIQEEDKLSVNLNYTQGKLKVNDTVIPL